MRVTASVQTKIINAMTTKGLKNAHLGDRIGRSESWVQKLLSPKKEIAELKSGLRSKIEDVLEIELQSYSLRNEEISPTALALSQLSEQDSEMAVLLETLLNMASKPEFPFIPVIETEKLELVGKKIRGIVEKWHNPDDPHDAKIAVEVLDYLRNYFLRNS